MKSHHPIPHIPESGWARGVNTRGRVWECPAPPRGGIGEAIAAIVAFVVEYYAVIQAVIAVASVAYSLNAANQQRKEALRNQFDTVQRNAFRNFRQPLTPRRILYGRARVGGPIIFAHTRDKFEFHVLIGLCGHQVHQIESVWLLQEQLPYSQLAGETFGRVLGKYRNNIIIWTFLGTPTQDIGLQMRTAVDPRDSPTNGDSIALTGVVETTDKFHGIAAIYAVTKAFSVSFEGQSPEFSAIVRGKRLLDTRTNVTAYSANPALAAADYLVNYMGFSWDAIDLPTLNASANICDQLVPLKAGGTERRYEANGVFTGDQQHREVLATLARCMAGAIRYSSGLWYIQAGAPQTPGPDTLHITESMILGEYAIALDRPDRTLPNAVRGNYMDAIEWQPMSFPQYEDAAAIAEEGGQTNWLELDLPLTTSHTMAQRIARIELRRARGRRTLAVDLDLRGLLVQPGDLVLFSSAELGMESVVFQVDSFAFVSAREKLSTRLELVEYSASDFDWTPSTDEADLNRGTVTIDGIRTKGVENPEGLAISATEGATAVTGTVRVTWGNPTTNETELKRVDISLLAVAETTDGTALFEWPDNAPVTASVTNGAETRDLNVSIPKTWPGSHIFVGIKPGNASTIQAFFTNNSDGPIQPIAPA